MTRLITPNTPNKARRWLRWLMEFAILALILVGVRTWQQWGMITGEAPSFERMSLNGQTVNLDDFRGKPVLIHFWADWCPMCKMEQSTISAISQDWPVITVAFQSGNEANVQKYMSEHKIETWLTIVDADGTLAKQYGVTGVPSAYILDAEGNIRFKEIGLTSSWGLRARLWLAQQLSKSE